MTWHPPALSCEINVKKVALVLIFGHRGLVQASKLGKFEQASRAAVSMPRSSLS
jgi:hypothetical protein